MKSSFKVFGVITIIALTVVSCASSGTVASSHWEETLHLAGRISDGGGYISGAIAFTDGNEGSKIETNGLFNYFRGIPDSLGDFSSVSSFFSDWEDAAASNDAQFYLLDRLPTDRSNRNVYIQISSSGRGPGTRGAYTKMAFVYVNQDVTINGAASEKVTKEGEIDRDYGTKITGNEVTKAAELNLSLKAGWNGVSVTTQTPYRDQMPGLDEVTDISARRSSTVGFSWVLQ
jgi:hypothetical protein